MDWNNYLYMSYTQTDRRTDIQTDDAETSQDLAVRGLMTKHYSDVIMTTIASQITSLTIVYSTVYSDADQRKHQSSSSLASVWGIHRDRWIPRTNGQLRGKCFHLMTSSWWMEVQAAGHTASVCTDTPGAYEGDKNYTSFDITMLAKTYTH